MPVRTSGRTKWECGTQLSSMRAGNKATPSCLCCSVWAYRTPLRKCGNLWKKENGCSHSLMMCMSCVHQNEPASSSAETLGERAGIRMHTGKTRWNFASERPADMADLGPDVWNPLGWRIFLVERLAEEQKLWDAIPFIPDLQCSWCAGPRCSHLFRTVPPR